MRKITLLLVLILDMWTSSQAKQVDLDSSQGVDQDIIISFYPSPANIEVAKDATIKIVFDVKLDERHIKKNDIKLREISNRKKKIRGSVSYIQTEQAITFKPKYSLNVGFYELSITSLKATKEYKNQKIKKIKYYFYVPEVINGYMLPVEPDEKLNNSTLLGIDSNDNGIRDDVEIYVIKRYAQDPDFPKTKTALAMQYAWATQKILESPTIDSKKYSDDAIDCQYYWMATKTQNMAGFEALQYDLKHEVFNNPEIKDKIYNTRERIEQKFSYNSSLSGNIFNGREESIDNCQINIDELGE